MLSEDKIKKMIRLSEYEMGQGSTDLKRVCYQKADYVRLQILKTVVSVVLAAFCVWMLLAVYFLDYILTNALALPVTRIVAWTGGCVAAASAISSVIAWKMASRQYEESSLRAGEYYATLQELLILYEREESGQEEPRL